jgi:hypothetical protein
MIIPGPRGFTLKQWADQICLTMDKFGPMPVLASDLWKPWAAVIVGLPTITGVVCPNPYQFDDWRAWGEQFCGILAGSSL